MFLLLFFLFFLVLFFYYSIGYNGFPCLILLFMERLYSITIVLGTMDFPVLLCYLWSDCFLLL